MAAKKTFSKLLKVLDSAGFIHKGIGNSQYALGPAGTLLQHNIVHTWLVFFIENQESVPLPDSKFVYT